MDNEKDILKTSICVLLILFSVFLVVIETPHPSSREEEILLVNISNAEEIDQSSDLDVIDIYGENALLRGTEKEKRRLIERGFEVSTLPSRTEISLRGYTFDIEEGPDLSSDMKIDGYESGQEGLYLVHMLGPINPEWRHELEDQGVKIINYVPNYAYEVSMTPRQAEKVEDNFFVDWIGLYHPAYKLPENVETGAVNARFISDPEEQIVENDLNTPILNSRELEDGGKRLTLNVSSREELKRWAYFDDLYHLSNRIEPELHSEVDTQTIGGGVEFMDDEHGDPNIPYRKYGDFGAYINQMGYSGDGVTIAVADTGLGDGTVGNSGHPDLTGRVQGGHAFGELDPEDWDDGHGHGTHVTGSAAGDSYHGSGEDGEYPGFGEYLMGQGIAYDSDLYAAKIFKDSGTFLLQDDYYPIVEKPKQESDAYVHVNSWGARTSGQYTNSDSVFDQAVRDANRDTDYSEPMVITVSAGNNGPIEQTTGSPGNAKNVITVGATESYMPDGDDYGGRDTDELSSIARFSSRGWTEDNRVKPDLVAPGVNVLSLGSPSIFDGPTYDWKSGTSMSNPAVSGAASVVVEWYEKKFDERPSPAMVKALLINTAEDLKGDGCRSEPIPNKDEGWGMVDISKLEYPMENPIPFSLEDQSNTLQSGESHEYELEHDREGEPLKITLTWTDKNAQAGDDVALKNDLNLKVTSPAGDTYKGNAFSQGWTQSNSETMGDFDRNGDGWDDVNNVENVYIRPSEVEEGTYNVEIEGFNIPEDGTNDGSIDQDYALTVYNGKSSEMETTKKLQSRDLNSHSISSPDKSGELSDYSERDPIHIEGDEEFEGKAEQNGWPGSGTEEDPFVIEGYTIDGEEEYSPISIEDVESHFIIRDNRLYNANRSSDAVSGISGVYLSNTKNGSIRDNEIELNSYGVLLEDSQENDIKNNNAINNHVGFHLSSSEKNIIENNNARKVSHPTYEQGISLEDSKNNDISSNHVDNNDEGIMLKNSDKNILTGNNASYNDRGLSFESSSMNQIDGGIVSKNRQFGLYIYESKENKVLHLDALNNIHGAYVRSSSENSFSDNKIMDNRGEGIMFFSSEGNRVIDSTISNNSGNGLTLSSSQNHTLYNNKFEEDSINLIGRSVEYWNTHRISENNTISDGKRIYYLKNIDGDINEDAATIDDDAGQIILANSTNVVIEDKHIEVGDIGVLLGFSERNEIVNNTIIDQQESISLRYSNENSLKGNWINNNSLGLYLLSSDGNTISDNNLSNNDFQGLYLIYSKNNLIFGNEIYNNDVYGLYLISSSENTIYHNDITQTDHADLGGQSLAYDTGGNTWNHNMEGNYWSNYGERYPEAEESAPSGFWNISYEIMGGHSKDKYPLVNPEPMDDLSVFILEPGFKDTIFSSDVSIRWSSKGVTGDMNTRIRLNGDMWIDVTGRTEYIFEDLSDGDYTVEVRAEDAEEASSHSVEFEVNTDVFVDITNPQPSGIERRSTVRVEWIIENMEYSEIRLEGENNNTGWIDVGNKNEHTFRNLDDGEYFLSMRAFDEEGNIDSDSVGFSVRTVEVEIKGPEEGTSINSRDVTVEWTSQYAEKHYVSICGGRWNRAGGAQKYNFTDLREGEYEVYVRARDPTGRSSRDNVTFTVDVTKPAVRILEPKDGESLSSDSVKLRWEGYDDRTGIKRYEVRIDGEEWIEVENETEYLFEGLDDGNHTIEVRVWDEAGNSARDSVGFESDERSVSEMLRDNWWVLIIGAGILIILFDKIFWRRKSARIKGKSLDELKKELDRRETKKMEDEYKL